MIARRKLVREMRSMNFVKLLSCSHNLFSLSIRFQNDRTGRAWRAYSLNLILSFTDNVSFFLMFGSLSLSLSLYVSLSCYVVPLSSFFPRFDSLCLANLPS